MADLAKKTAARELGVSERTIDRLRNQGEITWHLVGAKVVIAEESIAAFRERQRDAATALQRVRHHEEFKWAPGGGSLKLPPRSGTRRVRG
jgi:hypothetical protein